MIGHCWSAEGHRVVFVLKYLCSYFSTVSNIYKEWVGTMSHKDKQQILHLSMIENIVSDVSKNHVEGNR